MAQNEITQTNHAMQGHRNYPMNSWIHRAMLNELREIFIRSRFEKYKMLTNSNFEKYQTNS